MGADIGPGRPMEGEREQWLTVRGCKKVLVIAQTLTYGQRLSDVFSLFDSDMRVQLFFTVAPHAFGEGVTRFLSRLGSPVIPWEEAVRRDFDLALAAGWEHIDQVRAPLVLFSHGAGHIKLQRIWHGAPSQERPPGMLSRDNLTRGGRVVPAAVALAHRDDLATLARNCPEGVPVATVVGDPVYDRLAVSLPRRKAYRDALGLRAGQKLVVVSSTWGQGASFAALDELLPRLLSELPRRAYRVAVLTHPNIWAGHGWWQVAAWLSAYRRRGIALVPPEADWRAVLAAADWVLGDHGSVTSYATLTPAPILLARYPHDRVHHASPAAALARLAPALSSAHPLEAQLRYAAEEYRREEYEGIAARLSSEPGRFNQHIRALVYGLLGIGRPAHRVRPAPVPLPAALDRWTVGAVGEAA
ncbi:hypothetical protein SAMN05216223_101286 [Actinacidiphila yanglinensis]|uniref:CDP-Glycerol:Poly(Glycerophosphate) glycerophosphotransferase n=1 Tax=Actinacidiphila yanglinensis TaxID=310779 RepID=A0A1H5SUU6_9ACTN|nr:hypothetical protein [Actinacidiphila yanglinensis]SEF54346.1 hypothetical protein SAMN05216223_101286 [Actinacidiphila yanglinensis]